MRNIVVYPAGKFKREQFVNRLNALHFRNDPILVSLEHRDFGYGLFLKAMPRLCKGDKLEAAWTKDAQFPRNIHRFRLLKIIIPGVASALEFIPQHPLLDDELFESEIPEQIDVVSGRKIARHFCITEKIRATLTQNSIGFTGRLVDFSPSGIRIQVTTSNPQNFYWLNLDMPATLTLDRNGETVYSGQMSILRAEGNQVEKDVVLQPATNHASRYRPKENRTKRLTIHPSPSIVFRHPLTGENHTLKVKDIATLGLCVEEPPERSVLLAGLLMAEVKLSVAGSHFISFSSQVVYRVERENRVYCGIAILDIKMEDHLKLIGLAHQADNEHAYVSISHDAESFFEFLFDCGFLYPDKYAEIDTEKEAFIQAYNKLYHNQNSIARCFGYIEDGQIQGHVSALKIYKYAWLNHHHAAISTKRVGLKVLRQISEFINDSFYLNPVQLRYVVGIYRPDNSFPSKFFGGFANKLNNPKKCSTDTFAYYHYNNDTCKNFGDLKGPWELVKAQESDMAEFEGFYNQMSGGLLAKAYDLNPLTFEDTSVATAYRASGLKRDRHLYAVRYGMDLKALVEVQDSDTGLNMSELTNAVTIYVLDPELFTPKVLETVECVICVKHHKENHPALIFPASYVEKYRLPIEKKYTIWVLNLDYADDYMAHLARLCR
jgi:hypothetical protein